MGVFPSTLGQATALVDLSADITEADAKSFTLSIVRSGTSEYVLLFSSVAFDSTRTHLLVLAPDLKVLGRSTMDDIDVLPPTSILSFKGSAAVTHLSDGRIIIGNVEAAPAPSGLTLLRKLASPANPLDVWLDRGTIAGPASARFTWTHFAVDSSDTLHYDAYANDWSSVVSRSQQIGRTVSFRNAFTNPEDDQSNLAILVFEASDKTTTYFFPIPKDPDLVNGLPGGPLFDNPAYVPFTKNNIDSSSIAVTSDSIVAYDFSTHSWIRFTPSAPDTVKRMYLPNRDLDTMTAFSFSGGYFCVWDPRTRVLTRYQKWW